MAEGKRFAQDFTRISSVAANDKILIQDDSDGVVKYANPSQVLAYISSYGGFQPLLAVSILSNGNIRIGNLAGTTKDFMPATPSGDPMHYAYEAAGAVWNGSTGYWQLNGIDDLTNADMRAIYELGNSRIYRGASLIDYFVGNSVRTNIPAKMSLAGTGLNLNYMATDQWVLLEVIRFTTSGSVKMEASALDYCFAGCSKLKSIGNPLDFAIVATCYDTVFGGCSALQTLQISNVACNLNVKDCPLSTASATYIIANASSSATFSVTFKASMQATYEDNDDFRAAKNAKPNITINYL